MDPNRRMTKLAQNFPSLEDAHGVDPWDAAELNRWAAGLASHGEKCAPFSDGPTSE